MKTKTLKENYTLSKIIEEKFDKQTMDKAVSLIKHLKSLDFAGAGQKILGSARDLAVTDITAVLAGDEDKGVIRKVTDLFKSNKTDSLNDPLTFVQAMHNFFELFDQYLEAQKTNTKISNKTTVQQLVTGENPTNSPLYQISDEQNKSIEQLQKLIIKGFKPDKTLEKLGKNWINKYVKGGLKEVSKEIMNANVQKISQLSKNITQKLNSADEVAQAAQDVQQVANKQPETTTSTEKSKNTELQKPTTKSGVTKKDEEDATEIVDYVNPILRKNNITIPDTQLLIIIQLLQQRGIISK